MMTDAQLRALAPTCTTLAAACKADFIRGVLTRAYRRPPSADEIAETGSVFDLTAATDTGDVVFPFRAVVQAALTSPFFLYRTEIGAAGNAAQPSFRITDHEVASFLSYSVLGQAPPAALLAAADRGELTNAATLKTNVDTLLAMPEAAAPLRAFLFQWLTLTKVNDDLYKFPDMFPGFDGVRGAMIDEANAFFTANAGMGGTLRGLLTAPVPAPDGRARDVLRRARRRRRHTRRLARAGRLPRRGRARGPELAHAARHLRARAAALPAHDHPAERPGAHGGRADGRAAEEHARPLHHAPEGGVRGVPRRAGRRRLHLRELRRRRTLPHRGAVQQPDDADADRRQRQAGQHGREPHARQSGRAGRGARVERVGARVRVHPGVPLLLRLRRRRPARHPARDGGLSDAHRRAAR